MTSPSVARIAVIIPCYRVAEHVLGVIERIGPEVGWIIAVDDACPQRSGDLIEQFRACRRCGCSATRCCPS